METLLQSKSGNRSPQKPLHRTSRIAGLLFPHEKTEPPSISDPKDLFTQIRSSTSRENVQGNLSRIVLDEIRIAQTACHDSVEGFQLDGDYFHVKSHEPKFALETVFVAEMVNGISISREMPATAIWQCLGSFLSCRQAPPRANPNFTPSQPAYKPINSTFSRAQKLDDLGQTDAALDLIYDTIDELMLAGKFDRLDTLLGEVEADACSADILLGLLTASLPGRSQLPSRALLYRHTERLLKERNQWEDGLLNGLEQ